MRTSTMVNDLPRLIKEKGRLKRSWRHPFNAHVKLQKKTKICPILNGKCLHEGCMAWRNGGCRMLGDD
jgi:hypothetical protein